MSYCPPTPHPYLTRSWFWVEYYETLFPGRDMPPKRWELEVATYLFHRRYHPDCIRAAIEHAALHGTFKGCDVFSLEYGRNEVESKLSRRLSWLTPASAEAAEFGPALT